MQRKSAQASSQSARTSTIRPRERSSLPVAVVDNEMSNDRVAPVCTPPHSSRQTSWPVTVADAVADARRSAIVSTIAGRGSCLHLEIPTGDVVVRIGRVADVTNVGRIEAAEGKEGGAGVAQHVMSDLDPDVVCGAVGRVRPGSERARREGFVRLRGLPRVRESASSEDCGQDRGGGGGADDPTH